MRTCIAMFVAILFLSGCKQANQGLPSGKWIDLSHSFSEKAIYWPTAKSFELEVVSAQHTEGGYYYAANNFSAAEHGGTHLDAPIHFYEGRWTSDQIPVDRLIGAAIVIDASEKGLADRDFQFGEQDFLDWEANHGRIPDDSIVLLKFGYAQYWPDRLKYLGTDMTGEEAVAELHFPALHPDGAKWLVANRKIKAIGLDTPSIDYGQSKTFESHQILFKENIPAFENVANLDQLPATGAHVFALPMKIEGGSGGPLRIIALVPDQQ